MNMIATLHLKVKGPSWTSGKSPANKHTIEAAEYRQDVIGWVSKVKKGRDGREQQVQSPTTDGPFDLWHERMWSALCKNKARGQSLLLLPSSQHNGAPQGCVLAPSVLYILYWIPTPDLSLLISETITAPLNYFPPVRILYSHLEKDNVLRMNFSKATEMLVDRFFIVTSPPMSNVT